MRLFYKICLSVMVLLGGLSLYSQGDVTFSVNLSGVDVSPDGVSVVFAASDASTIADVSVGALSDGDGDGIYTEAYFISDDAINYFFVNGAISDPMNFEMVPEECGALIELIGLTANARSLVVDAATIVLDPVCFSGCGACAVTDCDNPAVVFTDDASSYDLGPLAPTGPWSAWPGGAATFEIDTIDGDNVFAIVGSPTTQDAYFDTGDLTSGHYFFSWNMYIPAGNSAYFNVQHQDPTTTAGFWAFDVFFDGDGVGVLDLNDNSGTDDTTYGFDYPEDEFFYVALIIDIDNDQARLVVGEYTIASWVFSEGVTNGNAEFDLAQFSGINFYPIDDTHVWFLDNMSWLEIPAAGPDQYCYTASVIEPGTHTVNELSCFGGGIHHDAGDGFSAQWFQYTPAADGWISISSCEGGADTRGWILRGDCNSLEIIGVNDDQCAIEEGSDNLWASYREAVVQGGQTYYIMWEDVWDDAGFDFELSFFDTELVEGDFCESAAVIQPGEFEILEFTGNAAYTGPIIDNRSQGRSPTPYAQTEWYQFTPTVDGTISISSCELSASDTRVWVYTGECGTLSSLTLVAVSDDDCPEGAASFIGDFPVTAGTTYYIEWDNGWSSDGFGWELIFNAPVVTSDVTFQVDMNREDISPDGVFIAGGFSDFMNVAMDDADADGIYTVTLPLEDNTMYTYKFKNGPDGWETIDTSVGDDCTTGDFADRFINTGDMDVTLDVVCFGYCTTCDLIDNVDELTFAQSVDLFPNPTDGQLQVRINLPEAVDGLRLRVSSILGNTLIDRQLGNLSQYNEQIDLSAFPAGTYVVTLTNGSLQVNRKVVVK
ncbi:T9SS type A sorting domain-containing protein [Lewinella cohaerens]|uniref:T9SS type A sorting domain-containing protein n=1 Tax=Lewinella cohaerens TaxID=70995 RepID=UPI000A048043|nr:T9SS type A sorting domain-containing protein [Lewinella cohaerens]